MNNDGCANCALQTVPRYRLIDDETEVIYRLCSLECLQEWAWKTREAQSKLSKSRIP